MKCSYEVVASSSSPPPKHPSICIKSDSRFNHFNTSFAQFKYAVFQISIIVASNYTFSTKDDVNTHIGIYNNTFYRENPKLNLLAQSEKSELTFFLQPWTSYMVLVIPLYSDRIGRFSIVACGPLRFALRPIRKYNSILIHACFNTFNNRNATATSNKILVGMDCPKCSVLSWQMLNVRLWLRSEYGLLL